MIAANPHRRPAASASKPARRIGSSASSLPLTANTDADAFAVAQRARQRDHALDVAVAELAAAVAADEREPARAAELLLLHMRVECAQRGLALEQQQKIAERGLAGFGVEPGMHRLDEGEIVRRVDGEAAAFARQRRIRLGARDGHEIGMQLEIAGDVLARDRIVVRVHHQLVERAARERIDALMRGDRAVFQQHVIAALLDHAR